MATKAKHVQLSDMKAGVTIYKVYALGCSSYIEELYLSSKPFPYKADKKDKTKLGAMVNKTLSAGLWCSAQRFTTYIKPWRRYTSNFSLRDSGIQPNKYNDHQSFTTRNAANRYLQKCLERRNYKLSY